MFRTRCAVALLAILLSAPGVARASGTWQWPVSGGVSVGYGQSYVDGQGRSCTHGGVDIVAAAGAEVEVCAAGQVAFAGLVPAGTGNRAYAVTVLSADGLRVTYLPLRTVSVRKGDSVSAGDKVGAVAGAGDSSSAAPHVHLGVRRGEAALDPLSFLGATGGSPEPAAPASPAAPKAAAASPVGRGAGAGRSASKEAPSHASAPGRAPVPLLRSTQVPVPLGSAAPAPSTRPLTLQDAVGRATRAASGAAAASPAMTRVSEVAATPQLRFGRMMADLGAGKSVLASWLLRLALVAMAGACVAPVWKGVKAARAQAVASHAPIAIADRGRQ